MNRREFTQTALFLGAATNTAAQLPFRGARQEGSLSRGGWRAVPAAQTRFEWHKVVARPRSSPGLTNWCFLDRNPAGNEIIVSFTEITDPGGKQRYDPPRYDFSGLRLTQVFLISRDRGETWRTLAEHDGAASPGSWPLNGFWEKLKFLPDGSLLGFGSQHTQNGRRPMLFYRRSADLAKTWSPWRPVTDDPKRSLFSGDACRLADGRWIHFHDLYDMDGPTFRCRIRRKPDVYMDRPQSTGNIGCAISEDEGKTWRDRPDLDLRLDDQPLAGEPYEPAVAQLPDGRIVVVARRHRRSAFGGEGLPWRQWILEPTGEGFRVLSSEECQADVPLGHTGHPELVITRDGILFGVRSDGLWASVDGARFWEKADSQYLGYYPQAVELDDGSLLAVGHHGGDNPWPPGKDQDVRLTKLGIDRTPVLRNLDRGVPIGYTLEDRSPGDVRVRATLGAEAGAGLLARARVEDGKVSGYVLYVTARQPAWLLGRLQQGRLQAIASGKLPGLSLTSARPQLELAVVGDTVRAFVNTYPVASGRDRHFTSGSAGLLAEAGRVRVERFEVGPATLDQIGGREVELVRDLGAMGYEQAADNWEPF